MLRTIQGYIDVTVRVPFTVFDDPDDDTTSAQDWADMANSGITPDAMEGAVMESPDSKVHEVVASEISEAWCVTADHDHRSRCCTEHGTHVMPHRGCVLR